MDILPLVALPSNIHLLESNTIGGFGFFFDQFSLRPHPQEMDQRGRNLVHFCLWQRYQRPDFESILGGCGRKMLKKWFIVCIYVLSRYNSHFEE